MKKINGIVQISKMKIIVIERRVSGVGTGSSNGSGESVGPEDYKKDKEDKTNGQVGLH